MILDHEKISRIKTALKFHKKGMSISEIARQLKMNRNSVAKYLEILLISGQVEAKKYGISKVYTLSQRVPVSAMMGFSSDMIVMVDGEHRIIQVNDRLLQVAGVQRQAVIGQRIEDTGIPFLDALPIDSILEESAEKRTVTIEKHVEQKGCDAFFSIKMVSTIFDDGKEGVTIIIEDISNRRKTEIALANSVQLYQNVIGNIQDVFYRSDKNGNLIMASPSFASMLGYDSLDDCIGQNIAEKFYMEPQSRKKFLDAVYAKGSVSGYDVVLKKKDGTPLYVSTNSHLYNDDSSSVSGVEGIFRDVTDLHYATEQVRQHIEQMEFFSRKLQEFIEFPRGSDVYEKIAADLKSLIPHANITVCSFNDATMTVTLRSLLFGTEGNKIFYDHVGRDPVGLELPVTTEAQRGMREGRLLHLDLSLYEMLFKSVPIATCNKLEELYDFGKNYGIGFVREGVVLGNAAIFLQKNRDIPDVTLVETYAHAASIALQRHIAEDELRKSEELFFNFAEQSPLPIAIIDPDGTYRYINRNFTRTFGYDLNDFQKGREWFLLAFPDPDYRKKVISAWMSDLTHSHIGDVRERLFTVRCKDGSGKEIDFRPVTLSDGKQCVIYEDITSHLQARRERQFLSSIVKSTGDTIIGKDIRGNILSWNHAAEHLYGYTAEEIIGHNITEIIPRERRHEMDEILSKIKNGESVNSLETFRVKKDGTVIEVAVTISPIMDDDGVVIGASTIARDISFKKAEERLRASEEQYRSLVDNIAVGVYRSTGDPTGRFIWGNTSLVKILGYSSLEILKKIDVADIFVKEGGRRKLLEELKQAGFVKNKEILLKRADGKTIHVMVTALAKFDQKGDLVCINGLVEDITGQRQAESQLQTIRNEIVDIIEFQPDATFVIDNEKKVIAWNLAIERLTGIKKADILGKGNYAHAFAFYGTSRPVLIDLIDSSDEELQRHYAEVKREGIALVAEVFAPELNTGMGAFLWAKASPLVDPSGNRIGAIETIRDISDNKRWQAQTIARSDSRDGDDKGQTQVLTTRANAPAGQTAELLSLIYLSNALRMAQDGITILDLSARCIWANEALITLLCTGSSEAITGKSIASYIASEMRKTALDKISEVRRLGHAEFPLSLMTPGGRVPVEARVSTVSDQGGELIGYMAILRRMDSAIPRRNPRHDKP